MEELEAKSKVEDDLLVETLMMNHHVKNFPILPRDKKEVAFFRCYGQTDTQTHRHSQILTMIDLIVKRSVDQYRTI